MNNYTDKREKIEQLERALVRLWDSLPPKIKGNKSAWNKFLNIQNRVRLMNLKSKGKTKNESTRY